MVSSRNMSGLSLWERNGNFPISIIHGQFLKYLQKTQQLTKLRMLECNKKVSKCRNVLKKRLQSQIITCHYLLHSLSFIKVCQNTKVLKFVSATLLFLDSTERSTWKWATNSQSVESQSTTATYLIHKLSPLPIHHQIISGQPPSSHSWHHNFAEDHAVLEDSETSWMRNQVT